MKELTEKQKWELGESNAFKFFGDSTRKEVFKMTCDAWYKSKSLASPLDYAIPNRLKECIYTLVGWDLLGMPLFDENYIERIWVQVLDRSKEHMVNLFYYDCFYGKFIAFEETE